VTDRRRYDFRRQHYAGQEGALIPLLQEAQEHDGYLSRERMAEIHEVSGVPIAQIYGVATFYAQFRFTPVGKNLVKICHGTACHVSGANEITDAVEDSLGVCTGETTSDQLFTLEMVSCLGCCSLAPVIMVNDTTHGKLNDREVRRLVKSYRTASAAPGASRGAAHGSGESAGAGGTAGTPEVH
jgi:NADH:ubiquinone oxidoreductase subunit E